MRFDISDAGEWSEHCFYKVGYPFTDESLIGLGVSQQDLELSWNANFVNDEPDFYFTNWAGWKHEWFVLVSVGKKLKRRRRYRKPNALPKKLCTFRKSYSFH